MDRLLHTPESKADAEDAIRVDTLDNITAKLDMKHIDLVMMDIEGYWGTWNLASEGMKKLLSKKAVKHLIIQVHPKISQEIGKTDAEVIQLFENSGYKVDKFHKESEVLTTSTPILSSLMPFLRIFLLYWLSLLRARVLPLVMDFISPKAALQEDWHDTYFDCTAFDFTGFAMMDPPAVNVRFDTKWTTSLYGNIIASSRIIRSKCNGIA
jgi:hypothetical protein